MRQRTQQNAGPGLPQTADQRIRWMPFKNYSDETIPPFACMEVALSSGVDDGEGEHVWRAFKPTLATENAQNPSALMFNGETAVPKDQTGRGTFDLPARAIVQSDQNITAHALGQLGPRNESWLLWEGGTAFNYVMQDRSEPMGEGTSSDSTGDVIKAVWVNRRASANHYSFQLVNSGSEFLGNPPIDVAADAYVSLGNTYTSNPNFSAALASDGLYFISADATVGWTNSSPSNNALLALTLWLADEQVWPLGVRYPFKPGGVYETGETIENVAFAGLVNVDMDGVSRTLRVRNSSAYSIRIYTARLTAFLIAPPISE